MADEFLEDLHVSVGGLMGEFLTLTATDCYRVTTIALRYDPPDQSRVDLRYLSKTTKVEIPYSIIDSTCNAFRASSLITSLNKANLTNNSLHRRAIQLGIDDGVLPSGTIGGNPD